MPKTKPYTSQLKALMAEKSRVLSKAEAVEAIGLGETAQSLWETAAAYEERIAPLLEVLGREAEAALHRISAASCHEKRGEFSRAANLYRAALAGPLTESVMQDVHTKLAACLKQLHRDTAQSVA